MMIFEGWKNDGTVQILKLDEAKILTRHGGSVFSWSDGLIDPCCFARKHIHSNENPLHIYGGPLIWAESYRGAEGYKANIAECMFQNMMEGMIHKGTTTILPYLHWLCGMMKKYGHDFLELPILAEEIVRYLLKKRQNKEMPFDPKIYPLLHVKKHTEEGVEEQRTYKLCCPSSSW